MLCDVNPLNFITRAIFARSAVIILSFSARSLRITSSASWYVWNGIDSIVRMRFAPAGTTPSTGVEVVEGASLVRVRRVRTVVQRGAIEWAAAAGVRDRDAGRVQQDIAASGRRGGGGGVLVELAVYIYMGSCGGVVGWLRLEKVPRPNPLI